MTWMSAYLIFLSLVAVAYAAWFFFRACRVVMRLPRKSILAFLFFSAVATVVAQKPPAHMPRSLPVSDTVTDGDIERGYALVETIVDAGHSFALPTNATIVGNWHKRGTFGEWLRLELGGFEFPMGTNGALYSSFSVFNDGKIRPTPRDTAHEISAVGVPMLAMQGASRFWTMDSDDGSKLLTWENFFLNADTNAPVNAQIRLCPGGDFTARSNEVARQYRRINVHDIDGDGLANEIDPLPRHCDGDFFGTSPEWRELECGGIGNSNAYYFAEFSATGSLGVARIDVVCDGTSNLGDMTVIARSGQTCRVPLLIGADYEIVSDLPFEAFSLSDTNASAVAHSDRRFHISYPLRFSFVRIDGDAPPLLRGAPPPEEDEGGAKTNIWRLDVRSVDPGIEMLSVTGACCNVWIDEALFFWECEDDCSCNTNRPEILNFILAWEGHTNSYSHAFYCPCRDYHGNEDLVDGNGVMVYATFSTSTIAFENSYANDFGCIVPHKSTESTFSGGVTGGVQGGVVSLHLTNNNKIGMLFNVDFPMDVEVPPGESFSFEAECFGVIESDTIGDVSATVVFTENNTGRIVSKTATLTVARVEITPQVTIEGLSNRHKFGVGENVVCQVFPSTAAWNMKSTKEGAVVSSWGGNIYKCPYCSETNGLAITIMGDCEYVPDVEVLEPAEVFVSAARELAYPEAITNVAGWAGMVLNLNLLPTNVSFMAVCVVEVPEYGGGIPPTGYFTNEIFSAIWHHTTAMGAGVWNLVRGDNNLFAEDNAVCGEGLPQGWSDGQITWRIPMAWGYSRDGNETYESSEFGSPAYQIFTMNTDGVLRITKHAHWVERTPGGIRLRSDNVMEATDEN